MLERLTQLTMLTLIACLGAGCASSPTPADTDASRAPATAKEVTGERAREVIAAVAAHAPGDDATVAQRLLVLAAESGGYEETLPVGWRVMTKPDAEDAYTATFVWSEATNSPDEHRFAFVVSGGAVEPANASARQLLDRTMDAPAENMGIIPATYDADSGAWTGGGAKLMKSLKAQRRLETLAAVLDQPWLAARMSAWMRAKSIHAEAIEACSNARKCRWLVDPMNDEWMRVVYQTEFDEMPGEVVWHVSGEQVVPRSPLAYLLQAVGEPVEFEVPADRPLRAKLSADEFHFEERWLTDVQDGKKGQSTGVFAATDRWRDEIRLAVLLLEARGVSKPVLEIETHPDQRAFVLGLFVGIAYEQGVDDVRITVNGDEPVTLPELQHESASELPQDALLVTVRGGAFDVARGGESFDALEDCPDDGPTVCPRGSKLGADRFDVRRLYNVVARAKSDSGNRAIVGFDNDVPASVIYDLLWLLRTRLEGAPFATESALEEARADSGAHGALFGQVERAPYSVVYAESFPTDVPAKLTRAMVRETIREANEDIYYCAASSNPEGLSGRMMVHIHVEMSGRVSTAKIRSDEFRGTSLGDCVRDAFYDLQFPRTRSDLKINYPVVFE